MSTYELIKATLYVVISVACVMIVGNFILNAIARSPRPRDVRKGSDVPRRTLGDDE
jgi:hypothetical protein